MQLLENKKKIQFSGLKCFILVVCNFFIETDWKVLRFKEKKHQKPIQDFLQIFLTKKNITIWIKKLPKLPRNSFLISEQKILRLICQKSSYLRNISKFIQQRFYLKFD